MARKTITQWISEALNDPDKEAKCSSFVLVHKQGTNDVEVHTTRLTDGRQFTSDDLGRMFQGKANVYAQDLQGVQTFNLLAFYGTTQPEARFPFLVNSSPDAFSSGLATEAPTAEGRLQQRMRHDEMVLQQTYRRQEQLDSSCMRLIDNLSSRMLSVMHENAEAFNLIKELLMSQASRDHEFRLKEQEALQKAEERKVLMKFAPALMNVVAGKDIFPQSTQDTAIVEMLAEQIPEDQFRMLVSILKPEVAAPLTARFEQILREKRETAEEAKKTAIVLSANGEAEAAGEPH